MVLALNQEIIAKKRKENFQDLVSMSLSNSQELKPKRDLLVSSTQRIIKSNKEGTYQGQGNIILSDPQCKILLPSNWELKKEKIAFLRLCYKTQTHQDIIFMTSSQRPQPHLLDLVHNKGTQRRQQRTQDQGHMSLLQKPLVNQDLQWDKNTKLKSTMFPQDQDNMIRMVTESSIKILHFRNFLLFILFRFGGKLNHKSDSNIPGPG